ncbi:MAG: hypothetical protein NC043_06030 [Muribaculaceae bacterium]|nr:hypothetical protein [Muribaculaceae bacterium]
MKLSALLTLILLCLSASLLPGCGGGSSADAALDRAEALIDSVPAEGLRLLDSIPEASLTSEHARALHSLLSVRVRHRLHMAMPPEADSLMEESVRYFEDAGSKEADHLKMAYFYQGVVQYLRDNYTASLRSALQCIDAATELDDHYYIAKAHELIADIYYDSFNDHNYACKEIEKAIFHYTEAGYPLNVLYLKRDLAINLFTLKRYDESLRLVDSLISITDSLPTLKTGLTADRIRLRVRMGRAEECEADMALYKNADLEGYGSEPHFVMADYALATGNYDEAASLMDSVNDIKVNNKVRKRLVMIDVLKHRGDYKEALRLSEEIGRMDDSTTKAVISLNPTAVIDGHNRAKARSDINRMHRRNAWLMAGIVITIIALGAGAATYRFNRRRKNEEMEALLHELYLKNEELEKTYTSLQTLHTDASRANDEYYEVLRNHLSHINVLCLGYFGNRGDKTSEARFIKEVNRTITEITTPESICRLEDHLNKIHNNIMLRIRTQLPDIKEHDIRLLIFLLTGLSTKAISLFTGQTVTNCYVRKNRLISRLKNKSSEEVADILDILSKNR